MASAAPPSNSTEMVGLMPPPPGVTPDFFSIQPVQNTFTVVFAVFWGLATVALMLRIYTRAFLVKSLGWDEPLLVAAWAVTFVFGIMSIRTFPFGFGRHLWDVTAEQLAGYFGYLLILAYTYLWPPTLSKLSILVLYWRISPERWFRAGIIAMAFILVAYTVTFTALFAGPCNPNLGTPESAVCLNNIAVSQAVLNIVTDGVMIIMPIPTIHALHMRLKQKIVVGFILALGSGACIASIIRVAYVRAMVDNPDVTFTQCSAAVWSLVEMNLGVMCNSLAALKPFLRRHLPGLLSLTGTKGSGNKTPGDGSYAKKSKKSGLHSKGSRWGHSYQLHSVGKSKMDETTATNTTVTMGRPSADGKNGNATVKDIVVDHEFAVDFEVQRGTGKRAADAVTTGKGDSTDSILRTMQYPAHQPV
ncbi:puromycin-sensitive aminopeptidase [Naviculisporaceae sp. PSN 640]